MAFSAELLAFCECFCAMTREFLEYILRPVESWDTQTCVVDINFFKNIAALSPVFQRGWCKMRTSRLNNTNPSTLEPARSEFLSIGRHEDDEAYPHNSQPTWLYECQSIHDFLLVDDKHNGQPDQRSTDTVKGRCEKFYREYSKRAFCKSTR